MLTRFLIVTSALFLLAGPAVLSADNQTAGAPAPSDQLSLVDLAAYPEGWEARGGKISPSKIFEPVHDSSGDYLRAVEGSEAVRIFEKIAWDSAALPVLQWRWRVTAWPDGGSPQVAVYVSLDTDVFGIPTIIKYLWSRDQKAGTVVEGGFFRPMELVIRSGAPTDDWQSERIDVRADFERLIGRAPKGAAYGIGLLADPGVAVEIGEIVATPR